MLLSATMWLNFLLKITAFNYCNYLETTKVEYLFKCRTKKFLHHL